MKPHIVKKDVMIKMLDAEQAFTIYIVEKVAGYIVSGCRGRSLCSSSALDWTVEPHSYETQEAETD